FGGLWDEYRDGRITLHEHSTLCRVHVRGICRHLDVGPLRYWFYGFARIRRYIDRISSQSSDVPSTLSWLMVGTRVCGRCDRCYPARVTGTSFGDRRSAFDCKRYLVALGIQCPA